MCVIGPYALAIASLGLFQAVRQQYQLAYAPFANGAIQFS
jgi:hypothetical protein